MPRSQTEDFDPELFLIRKLEEMPATDIAILSTGAFLGWHGYTPLTALIGFAGQAVNAVRQQAEILQQRTGIPSGIGLFFPLPFFIASLLGQPAQAPSNASAALVETFTQRMLQAGIGAIEAYALTRPGAIGGILQGIGEIVPL